MLTIAVALAVLLLAEAVLHRRLPLYGENRHA